MKTKKPTSMATVLSRTCPRCFTMVDPVWYGWHITKCTSSDKQDMAPSTTLMTDEVQFSQLVGSTCGEVSILFPASCTPSLASESQFIAENCREEDTKLSSEVSELESTQLRAEKQALADRVKDLERQLEGLESQVNAEKQAMAKKVNDLELNVEKLECELKLSKESERKALLQVESLWDISKEENGHINQAGQCNQLLVTATLEPSAHEESMDFGNDEIGFCDKQGKEVDDRDECSDPLKKSVKETVLTKNTDIREEIQLDRVVGLACTGGPMSDDFLSQVDGFIESHKVFANTSRMREVPFEPSVNTNHGDPYQDIQGSKKQHSHNGSPPFTIVVNEEPHTAPRDALGTPSQFSNEGSLSTCQAGGLGSAKPNGDSVVTKMNDCGLHLDAQGAALELLFHALDKEGSQQVPCEEKAHAKQGHSHSSSSSSETECRVFKAKAGLRRIVLSESETEGGNMQGNCEGDIHTGINMNICNSKESDLPYTSTRLMEEQRHDSSAELRARDTCTANGVDIGVSQQPLPTRKQLIMLQSSDIFDDDVCNGLSKPSSPKGPIASASNPEVGGVGGTVEDGEHTGARRRKRLRRFKAQDKDAGIPSSKRKCNRMVVASSSSRNTSHSFEGFKECKSKTSRDTRSKVVEASLEVQGIPSSKKRVRRRVVVPSSDSDETSSRIEGSKRPQRVRKRLFEEVESKPAYGNNHSSDSEEDDSERESDEDSLKDFVVTDSEDTEESRSSDGVQLLSGSHSSREAFCDPRLTRDIKMRSYVWELEPEMLATFAIDPELCLRAVCTINRRQTEDEQKEKEAKYVNKRGFDKLHARRGTRIAEFLTDGDPEGPVKKSIEDLKEFDAGGLRFCKMMAAKHSRQLFEIYTTAEDPHFPFS